MDCFGTKIDLLSHQQTIDLVDSWIQSRASGNVVRFANVHMVMEARRKAEFNEVGRRATLSLPDGMPLVWFARLRGAKAERVSGPDFMLQFCKATADKKYRHYFYGGAPGVAEAMASRMRREIPALQVAGVYSPPFRELSEDEDRAIVQQIRDCAPDVIWVGLGCPKQEVWMDAHRDKINVPVMFGVGQAFDIHSGRLKRAPLWMQHCGLEWLFRLALEPQRLWRRYLVYNSQFLWLALRAFATRKLLS